MVIIVNATKDKRGIVINPSQITYFVVQETPRAQGTADSGIMPS